MKIATFNINNINRRLQNLLTWLDKSRPDVVCLQEIKSADEAFPIAAIEGAGYHAVWQGQRTWNGVAILAKNSVPVVTRRTLPGDTSDTQSRYLEAAVNGVVIASIYLPNGNPQPGPKFEYKNSWFARLARHATRLYRTAAPVILAGDYNVVPTDADIYATKSWKRDALLQPEPRAAFAKLLKQGWVDSIRRVHGEAQIFTFWDYFRNHWPRNAGLRIDHLLLNQAAAQGLTKAGVDRDVRGAPGASDHAPVWIVLENGTGRVRASRPKRPRAAKPRPS